MSGKIVVLAVIVLIVVLVIYLMHDSGFIKDTKNPGEFIRDKIAQLKENREVEITNAPVLYVKNPGEQAYRKINVTKKKFIISSNKRSDLVLDSKKVEDRHAAIVKRIKGDRVFYEFINYAQTNPSEYYVKRKNAYYTLRKNAGVELDSREAFYVGDTKIIVVIPAAAHIPTDTESVGGKEYLGERTAYSHMGYERPTERVVNRKEIDI